MKAHKKIWPLLFICMLLSSCTNKTPPSSGTPDVPSEESQPYILSIATAADWRNSIHGVAMEKKTKELAEWSGGRMEIHLYDQGKAGGDSVLMEGAQLGSLSIVNSLSSVQVDVVPEAALFGSPGILTSPEVFNAMMAGDYGQEIQRCYNEKGLQLLACYATDYRVLLTEKPVHAAEDLKGVRLRILDNAYDTAFWTALGAQAEYIDFGELYLALQSQTVDAMENPLSVYIPKRFAELRKHITLTRHSLTVNMFIMNLEQYEAMPEEYRDLLNRFLEGMEEELLIGIEKDNERIIRTLEESYGVEFSRPSDEFHQQLGGAGQVVLDLLRQDLGDETVDRFLKAMEEAELALGQGT